MLFGTNLKSLREQRGLTLTKLAAASGLTKGFISQLESGHSAPSLATLAKLASALRTTPADLIADQSTPPTVQHQQPSAYKNLRFGPSKPPIDIVERSGGISIILVSLDTGSRLVARSSSSLVPTKALATVRRGSARYTQTGTTLSLSEGDVATWELGLPYAIENNGPGSAELLLCLPS